MNNAQQTTGLAYQIPPELEEMVLSMIRTSPLLSTGLTQTIFRIAAIAFCIGIDAGMDKAITRIEETKIKLQALSN